MRSSVGQDQVGEAFLFFVFLRGLMVLFTSLFTSQSMLRSLFTIFLCGGAVSINFCFSCSMFMSVPLSPPACAGVLVT